MFTTPTQAEIESAIVRARAARAQACRDGLAHIFGFFVHGRRSTTHRRGVA